MNVNMYKFQTFRNRNGHNVEYLKMHRFQNVETWQSQVQSTRPILNIEVHVKVPMAERSPRKVRHTWHPAVHTHTNMHTCTHTRARSHSHTHTRKHTHTRTHTHAHNDGPNVVQSWSKRAMMVLHGGAFKMNSASGNDTAAAAMRAGGNARGSSAPLSSGHEVPATRKSKQARNLPGSDLRHRVGSTAMKQRFPNEPGKLVSVAPDTARPTYEDKSPYIRSICVVYTLYVISTIYTRYK